MSAQVDVIALLEAHGVKLDEIEAWTMGYFPLRFGPPWCPMYAKLKCTKPQDLGKGFYGVLITGPEGATAVCEATTGAVVGETLEAVRKDIADCADLALMQKQVADAADKAKRDRVQVTPEEFWERLLAARARTTPDNPTGRAR